MLRKLLPIVHVFLLAVGQGLPAQQPDEPPAANEHGDPAKPGEEELVSQPVLVPIISSDPKIATSAGLMVAYAHQFDADSPRSLIGAVGAYSTTDSYYYGLFTDAYLDHDTHRFKAALFRGLVRNDYEDFLGTGLPAQTTDDMHFLFGRYQYNVYGRWYLGVQALATNYLITGANQQSQDLIDLAGLTGVDAVGVGLAARYDTKDNQNSPLSGMALEIHNLAFREALGSDDDFDALNLEAQLYLPHGEGNTLAIQLKGRWTSDAPPTGYSSVDLRGYIRGQYLAEHMTVLEFDERIKLTDKIGVAAFAGVSVLYGDSLNPDDSSSGDVFPNVGIGAFYEISKDRMAIRADYAWGKEGNDAFYLGFNQPF